MMLTSFVGVLLLLFQSCQFKGSLGWKSLVCSMFFSLQSESSVGGGRSGGASPILGPAPHQNVLHQWNLDRSAPPSPKGGGPPRHFEPFTLRSIHQPFVEEFPIHRQLPVFLYLFAPRIFPHQPSYPPRRRDQLQASNTPPRALASSIRSASFILPSKLLGTRDAVASTFFPYSARNRLPQLPSIPTQTEKPTS
jgi:hypothetical protein